MKIKPVLQIALFAGIFPATASAQQNPPLVSRTTISGGETLGHTAACPQFDMAFRSYQNRDGSFGFFADYVVYDQGQKKSTTGIEKPEQHIVKSVVKTQNPDPKHTVECEIHVDHKYVFKPVGQKGK